MAKPAPRMGVVRATEEQAREVIAAMKVIGDALQAAGTRDEVIVNAVARSACTFAILAGRQIPEFGKEEFLAGMGRIWDEEAKAIEETSEDN